MGGGRCFCPARRQEIKYLCRDAGQLRSIDLFGVDLPTGNNIARIPPFARDDLFPNQRLPSAALRPSLILRGL